MKWLKEDLYIENPNWEQGKYFTKKIEENTILIQSIKEEEVKLDKEIHDLKQEFDKLIYEEDFKKFGYITHSDLKNLISNDKNVNLIAIKAPVGTNIEITDPNAMESIYNETKNVSFNFALNIFV